MKRNLIALILAALLMTSCAASATPSYEKYTELAYPTSAPAMEAPAAAPVADSLAVQGTSFNPIPQERLVIQNADLTIVVQDPQGRMNEIGAMAARLGGFVVSSNQYETTASNGIQVPEASITIRVPAKSLEDALTQIKTGVVDVQAETRSGQDVTDQYVDLQSRLKARQAAESQLLKMMEQAERAEDALAIFNQLIQIQSEIEVLKGQMTYFEQAAALSAISVRLVAEESIQPIEIAGWQPKGVARDAAQALVNFLQGFASFLIWLAIFILPVAVVSILLLALLWRVLRWFWRKVFPRKTPPPAQPAA
jgi:hypothetical protein